MQIAPAVWLVNVPKVHPSVPARVVVVQVSDAKLNPGAFKVNVLLDVQLILLPVETIVPELNVSVLSQAIDPENMIVPEPFIISGNVIALTKVPDIVPLPFSTIVDAPLIPAKLVDPTPIVKFPPTKIVLPAGLKLVAELVYLKFPVSVRSEVSVIVLVPSVEFSAF